jgi:hypothetical protein
MRIIARVIADSISVTTGIRLTSLELEYPRFVHAELMTHRVFSRNASSSRAIPVSKLTQAALDDPAFFVHIGKNQPGMQANEEVDEETKAKFFSEWRELAELNAKYALRWANDYGIHKQVVNRVMEPWHHIKVLVTATEWSNFLELRAHPDAQPEIHELALRIAESRLNSMPTTLVYGQWHLPYVSDIEREGYDNEMLIKFSVARCARTSYFNHDGTEAEVGKDLKLYSQLVGSVPLHASPAEHQATPTDDKKFHKNFRGWHMHRIDLEEDLEFQKEGLHTKWLT